MAKKKTAPKKTAARKRATPKATEAPTALTPAAFRDRILRFERVPAAELRTNPKNWRTHGEAQRDTLRGVLAEVGIADAVIARECADGGLELIDGHLRQDILAGETVPVLVLDVSEAEADKLLLTLDPIAEMAEANKQALEILLRDVQTGDEAVAGLLEQLATANDLVPADEGREAAVQPPAKEQYGVIVVCTDEEHQETVFEKLQAEGYECKVAPT